MYNDLWRTKTDRLQTVEYGIANENLRKLVSKDDSGANSGDTQKVSDGLMFSINGTKQKIQLGRILDNHGLYAPFNMNNNFHYILTLPSAASTMVAQSGSSVATYSCMCSIHLRTSSLEYETIQLKPRHRLRGIIGLPHWMHAVCP